MDTREISVCCVKFYDRLGICRAKILQQELWKHGPDWNKATSGDNVKAIRDWVNQNVRYGRVKQVGRWYSTWGHTGTSCIMRRIIRSNSSLHQDNQEPKNHKSFSDGKNKSGSVTSNNNTQNRIASSNSCSTIEENNRGRNGVPIWRNFLWSDSTTARSRINNFKLKHKMYIGNWIAEIRDLYSTNQ